MLPRCCERRPSQLLSSNIVCCRPPLQNKSYRLHCSRFHSPVRGKAISYYSKILLTFSLSSFEFNLRCVVRELSKLCLSGSQCFVLITLLFFVRLPRSLKHGCCYVGRPAGSLKKRPSVRCSTRYVRHARFRFQQDPSSFSFVRFTLFGVSFTWFYFFISIFYFGAHRPRASSGEFFFCFAVQSSVLWTK